MPEVPDLEAIRKFFNRTVVGETIERVDTLIPVVIRVPRDEFVRTLTGDALAEVQRHGKFLMFTLASGRIMVVNAMLTGRFSLVGPSQKRHARTCFVLALSGGKELRYVDQRVMGRVYLTTPEELETLPQFGEMGPDVLSPDLTEAVFRQRIKKYTGQIKSVLVNHKFVAGIGNAYADEILWQARLHPYHKRSQMTDEEVGALYQAVGEVLSWAEAIVWQKMGESLDYKEWRDHLRVHRKGGEACPRCGNTISEITAGQRITNFCRRCQPEMPRGI